MTGSANSGVAEAGSARVGQTSRRRSFLFLQGHPSRFAYELARALQGAGHQTARVNFCVGDWAFGLGQPAINYRGTFENWEAFLRELVAERSVTDIIYYNDCRPYHQIARRVANELEVLAFTYEFGYLRPDWLTFERNGMGGWSHFPEDPAQIQAIADGLRPADLETHYHNSVFNELVNEIFYNLSTLFLFPAFPNYNTDWYYNPLFEYISGIPRQVLLGRYASQANATITRLMAEHTSVFVVPLQLQSDYQLRQNANYQHQGDAIREIVTSFAAHAESASRLVFKCHPLDNGVEGWPGVVNRAAREAGVSDRVDYIDGGDLKKLLRFARGVITINSTVGMHGLIVGCPVKVLGTAIFDIEGLTHQAGLDHFWRHPQRPDPNLVDAFVRALAATTQVKGSFFDRKGQAAAVSACVERLTQGAVNGRGAYLPRAPRLEKGRAPKERY